MKDSDVGNMYLNFIMSEQLRPFCVMDVSNVGAQEDWERVHLFGWEIQYRNVMGFMDSIYHTFQAVTWSKTIFLENWMYTSNLFK